MDGFIMTLAGVALVIALVVVTVVLGVAIMRYGKDKRNEE
jgi:hypothetical protein